MQRCRSALGSAPRAFPLVTFAAFPLVTFPAFPLVAFALDAFALVAFALDAFALVVDFPLVVFPLVCVRLDFRSGLPSVSLSLTHNLLRHTFG